MVGLITNIKFLKNVLAHPAFFRGDYDTGFIQKYSAELLKPTTEVPNFDLASAIAAKLAVSFSKLNLPK